MRVMNNTSAMAALGELKKNDADFKKQLKKVASGMKINGAGDGASQYAISERMRVRLRALGQDEENVQTGASLLHVAEGGIQNQIEILKTIKQKVIDANNDTNTDVDRATIQKEIDQSYDQMQDIAIDTNYNGRRVLFGGTGNEKVAIWEVKNKAELVPESDKMEVIPDKYATLDGLTGPFDIFKEVTSTSATIDTLQLAATQKFSGAGAGTSAVYQMTFPSSYTKVSDFDNVGFTLANHYYVTTTDTSRLYRSSNSAYSGVNSKIDISGCSTVGDVIQKIADTVTSLGFSVTRSGSTLEMTTKATGATANNYIFGKFTPIGGEQEITTKPEVKARAKSSNTGYFSPSKRLSGGKNSTGVRGSSDPDVKYTPGQVASLTVNVSSLKAGTGITLSGSGTGYLRFVSGSGGFTKSSTEDNVWSVGVNGSGTTTIAGMKVTYGGGTIKFESQNPDRGGDANYYSISDGIEEQKHQDKQTSKVTYTAGTAFSGTTTRTTDATEGSRASYTIDLSNIPDTTDESDLQSVIDDLAGKAINYTSVGPFEFIDSSDKMSLNSVKKNRNAPTIDLASLRTAVAGGTTIRTALSNLLISRLSRVDTANSDADKVVVQSYFSGEEGNKENLTVSKNTLRSYDIDYADWFKKNSGMAIPNDLYDKGFHFYCATDASQWFNVVFTSGDAYEKDRPKSGTDTEDIKTMSVDVSKVTNASDLVTAIYEQTLPYLTGSDATYNHHYRMAADKATGVLTIYDDRPYDVSDRTIYDYQEKGAKIADGIMDNVIKSTKDMLVDRVIIQHTDHADQNIHLNLPRTTLDQIFQFIVGKQTVSDYNVMTKDMRERLLGNPPTTQGILDKGIQYLTDANAVIGAQTNHLSFAYANIKAQQEGTQSSESTIRDADMAKEMVNYTKSNILAQTAQSMLAQANQNASSVMNLLQ